MEETEPLPPPPEPERIRRRLAAILAADVAGYSRLTGLDEEGTTRQLIAARQVMDDLIAHNGGRIANTAGDSVIAEFASSVEAVRCALDIQEAMRSRHAVAYLAAGLMVALLAILGLVWGDRIVAAVRQTPPANARSASPATPAQPLAAGRAREVARATWEGHDYIAMQVWGSTWAEAEATARATGGHLVAITSAAENAVVYDLVAGDPDLWVEYDDGQMFGPWIGLYQPPGSDEPDGGWTLSSGEPVTYLNWSRGQPNNFGGDSNYARFHNDVALPSPFWDDSPTNSSANGFVVEREAEPAGTAAGDAGPPTTGTEGSGG
jgi:hypothetical protein